MAPHPQLLTPIPGWGPYHVGHQAGPMIWIQPAFLLMRRERFPLTTKKGYVEDHRACKDKGHEGERL